jgi:hypothetical protein
VGCARLRRTAGSFASVLVVLLLTLLPSSGSAQETGSLSGRLIDAASRAPIADVVVRLRGMAGGALSDANGRFLLDGLTPGPHVVLLDHIGYGEHVRAVVIEAGVDLRLQIQLTAQVVQLDSLVVEGRTELEERRISTGHAMNEIMRPEIDDAVRRGMNLGELLRQGMPSVFVRGGSRGSCVEFRGGTAAGRFCREVAVFIDGVQVSAPALLFPTLPLQDIERLEMLSPGEAGARYGLSAGWGVLLIETRTGRRVQAQRRSSDPMLMGANWSEELEPYRWKRVLGSSLLANGLGLGAALVLANQCLEMRESGLLGVDAKCNGIMTVGTGFITLGLPSVAGGLAARWAGTTERSRGRLVPSAVLGALSAAAGYVLVVEGDVGGGGAAWTAGALLLTVGTPLVTTLSDRVFRALR